MISKIKKIISRQSDVAKNGSIYLGSRVGTKILSFLMLPVWTTFLSPEQYGVIGLIVAYSGMVGALLLLGLPSAIVRHYHDYDDQWSGYIKTIFGYALGILFLVYMTMWMTDIILQEAAPDIIGRYRNVFWITLTGGVLTQLSIAGVQAERASKQFIIGNFISYLVGVTLSLLFVIYFRMGAEGFLYGMGTGTLVGVAYMVSNRREKWLFGGGAIHAQYLKKGMKYGALLLPTALSGWAINFLGRIIVERYSGLQEVGLFSFAGNLAMVMSFIMISLVQAWSPEYFASRKRGSENEIKASVSHIDGLATKFSLIVLIGIASFGTPMLSVLISDRYHSALGMITPLCVGYLFFGFTNIETRECMFLGKNFQVSVIYVIGAFVAIVGSLALVPTYGGYGASIASMVAMFIMSLLPLVMNRRQGVKILNLKSYGLSFVYGLCCIFADKLIPTDDVNAWLVRSFFALLMGGMLFVALNSFCKSNKSRVSGAV
ncbi:oligosaccharide flippase family protein [Verrucomicrobiaceae bacterium N1E253]|uniref:Oligosaccharide flippase family protein n=1 Tax=Oceaniferula marina TaxID=2748318 RepID=A0A851GKB3_9BACT|nr:oligosaccharide flippase family protein [Oceaniferula marina]NWK55160.1 oligosaccharide flippase family protein [Oceaniferula marina]